MNRKLKFALVTAVAVIVLAELQAWAFVHLSYLIDAFRFYPTDVFARTTDAQLAAQARGAARGWWGNDSPRAASMNGAVCGAAFGDSFTYGSEVSEDDAWVNLVSRTLGCTIANHGVPGYGTDEALLRYERLAPPGKLMLLGLHDEMIRRSVAASWTFYAPARPFDIYRVKPLFALSGDGVRLVRVPDPLTRESVQAHHAYDYFLRATATPLRFPYVRAAAHAVYVRMMSTDDFRRDLPEAAAARVLTRRLVERFARVARERSARPAVVMMANPQRVMRDSIWEQGLDLQNIAELCVVDTKPALRAAAAPLGRLPNMPAGHYTVAGNRLVADAVAEGLRTCGLGQGDGK